MSDELGPLSLLNSITIQKKGEDRRHMLARAATLDQLMQSPRVHAIFDRWFDETQLGTRLEKALEEMLRTNDCKSALTVAIEATLPIYATLLKDAERVAWEFHLPYPWAGDALIRSFIFGYIAPAVGTPLSVSLGVQSDPVTITVNSERELQTMYRAARPPLRAGRMPKKKIKVIGRNARWFVRHKIDHVSIRQLFREYREAHDCLIGSDNRNIVSYGIRETVRLLALSRYKYIPQ